MNAIKNKYTYVLKSIKKNINLRPVFNNLKNKTYVISGGTRGVGLEIAKSLSSLGANIAILGRTIKPHPKLEGTLDEKEGRTIWENKTGLSSEFFAYYRILALFKFSVIMVRVAKRLIFNEIMPLDSDFHVNNHVVAFLDKELNENN